MILSVSIFNESKKSDPFLSSGDKSERWKIFLNVTVRVQCQQSELSKNDIDE